jgi:hypothetical protein
VVGLLIANQLDQSLWHTGQSETLSTSQVLFITLFFFYRLHRFARPRTSHGRLCNYVDPKPFLVCQTAILLIFLHPNCTVHLQRCSVCDWHTQTATDILGSHFAPVACRHFELRLCVWIWFCGFPQLGAARGKEFCNLKITWHSHTDQSLCRGFLLRILWCSQSGNYSQSNLAKFGCILDMKKKNRILLYSWLPAGTYQKNLAIWK